MVAPLGFGKGKEEQGQLNILPCIQNRHEVVELEYVADVARTPSSLLCVRHGAKLFPCNDDTAGGRITTKSGELSARPAGVVTAILPVTAPGGTSVEMAAALSTTKDRAATPPNSTAMAPENLAP